MSTGRALEGTGRWLDDRFGGAGGVRTFLRKVYPDHWTFLLGEIALYSFVILLLIPHRLVPRSGLDEATARFAAGVDACIARGELETSSADLTNLLGRAVTSLTEVVRAAHTD